MSFPFNVWVLPSYKNSLALTERMARSGAYKDNFSVGTGFVDKLMQYIILSADIIGSENYKYNKKSVSITVYYLEFI